VQAVSQWGDVIADALLGQLLRRLLLGTGLPARASLWMSRTVLALGLGLWFSAASSISGSQLLWFAMVCYGLLWFAMVSQHAEFSCRHLRRNHRSHTDGQAGAEAVPR
jgi:hypothetical protein